MRSAKTLSYINIGQIKGINKVTSVKGSGKSKSKQWYDIGLQEAPKIIITRFYGDRHFAVYNKDTVQIEDIFFGFTSKEGISHCYQQHT